MNIVVPFQLNYLLCSTLFNNYDSDARMQVDFTFNTFKDKLVPMQFAMSTFNIILVEILFCVQWA